MPNNPSPKKYLLSKPEAVEDYPFGPDVMVFKVKGKMFATLTVAAKKDPAPLRMNLKCDPEQAVQLRDVFASVVPGYHMNKTHWNTIILDGDVPQGEVERMIDHSYGLVVKSLKKAERTSLELAYGEEKVYGV